MNTDEYRFFKKLQLDLRARREHLRDTLEAPRSENETASIRGRLAEVKALQALVEEAWRKHTNDEDTLEEDDND